ncbi:SigE family RNA polymerase sigma factor, partial [Streptomyces cavernae]|uniref:SigE family RNA polymerase sigma factor n=1 Tax=Streptomyces cavernae TaxID=2259034 RepID=UPI001EE41ABC
TDPDADFADFVTAHWPRLVRCAYLLTGDFHEAEDLVQSTLVKLHGRWSQVGRRPGTGTYVRRSLVNNNRSHHRKRRVAHLLTALLPDTPVTDRTDGLEHRDALVEALATLPERQRAVVILRYWDDLGESEVAAVLRCSVGTVKSQAARGLAKLRSHPALAAHKTKTV